MNAQVKCRQRQPKTAATKQQNQHNTHSVSAATQQSIICMFLHLCSPEVVSVSTQWKVQKLLCRLPTSYLKVLCGLREKTLCGLGCNTPHACIVAPHASCSCPSPPPHPPASLSPSTTLTSILHALRVAESCCVGTAEIRACKPDSIRRKTST